MWYKLCYYANHTDKYTEEERYELLRYIDERAIKGGRVEIEIHGRKIFRKTVYVLSKSPGLI